MDLADLLEFGDGELDDEIDAFLDDVEDEEDAGGMAGLAALVEKERGGKPSVSSSDSLSSANTPGSLVDASRVLSDALSSRDCAVEGVEALFDDGCSEELRLKAVSAILRCIQTGGVDSQWKDQQLEVVARLKNDIQSQDRTINHLYQQVAGGERKVSDIAEKERRLSVQLARAQAQAKERIAGLQTQIANLQRKEMQYKHEARRTEQRCAGLQQTVQKMMAKKDRRLQLAVDLEAQWIAQQSEGVRKAGAVDDDEELEEAAWGTVLQLTRELDDLLAELGVDCDGQTKHDLATMRQMPFAMAQAAVEASFAERFQLVRDACRRLT